MAIAKVITVIARAVNFVHTSALHQRHIRHLLEDTEAEFSDFINICEVYWLSRRKMLAITFTLREELVSFLREKMATLSPSSVGFTDTVLQWFSSHLTDRTHYVSLSNHCSAFAPVHSGISSWPYAFHNAY